MYNSEMYNSFNLSTQEVLKPHKKFISQTHIYIS